MQRNGRQGEDDEQILYEDFFDTDYLQKSKGSVSERKSASANKNWLVLFLQSAGLIFSFTRL